jgi:hypothetical protein
MPGLLRHPTFPYEADSSPIPVWACDVLTRGGTVHDRLENFLGNVSFADTLLGAGGGLGVSLFLLEALRCRGTVLQGIGVGWQLLVDELALVL